jgi:hypothetical protein
LLHPILRQPISATLILSLADTAEVAELIYDGITIPAATVAEVFFKKERLDIFIAKINNS